MASQSRKHEFSSNVLPFDPLRYAKQLEEAGFTRTQAEVQAETFFGIVNENLVTKRDLKELENKLALEIENVRHDIESIRRDIKELESNTKIQMEVLRRDLKLWFGSMLVTVVVAFSGLLTILPHLIRP